MNIEALLNYLKEELENASNMPLSNKCVIDRDKCLDIVGDIIENLPSEIIEAKLVRNDKDQIIYDAGKEAETIIEEANDKVESMVDQTEIMRLADEKSEQLVKNAQHQAEEIRLSANEYVEDILADLESYIQRNLDIVRQNRSQMRGH